MVLDLACIGFLLCVCISYKVKIQTYSLLHALCFLSLVHSHCIGILALLPLLLLIVFQLEEVVDLWVPLNLSLPLLSLGF